MSIDESGTKTRGSPAKVKLKAGKRGREEEEEEEEVGKKKGGLGRGKKGAKKE